MKKILLISGFLLLALAAFGQNVRYDQAFPSVSSTTTTPFLVANVPPNSPILAVCHHPANQSPCTNYITTYDSAGNACANGAQDTPQPQPSACQATGDAQGNIGFWVDPAEADSNGRIDYTVCVANNCFPPYTITVRGAGSALSVQVNGTAFSSSTLLNLTSSNAVVPVDDGSGAAEFDLQVGGSGSGCLLSGNSGNNSPLDCIPNATYNGTFAALQADFITPVGGTYAWQGSASGSGTISAQAAASSPNLLWPTGSGTLAVSASSPLVLNASTGNLTCPTCGTGSGTVTSVGLTVPGVIFSVSGSPVTTSGTLALSLLTQTANTVFAGPTSGGAATPTFRALVAADLPAGTGTVTSVAQSFTGGLISVSGSPITTSGTLALTVAGTSGGVPCFSSTSTWTSSSLLASGGVVLGGGSGTCPSTNTHLTFATNTLTIGLAGTGSGILALAGSTSGSATITAPATAGTATNPITISNSLQLPSGTVYNWNADTGLSRDSAGVIDVGNGTAADKSGSLNLTGITYSGQITSTVAIGTAPFVVTSTTQVSNLNVSQLIGSTWASPGAIGVTAPAAGNFTSIGATTSGSGVFTTLSTGAITGSAGITAGNTSPYAWSARSKMFAPSDGVIEFTNNAVTSFTRLDLGGTTSSFAALQISGTTITAGLADGTAGGTFAGATINAVTAYQANGTAGASAGPFTAISSITTTEGLVTALSGTSDERLKVGHDFSGGLAAILQIHPKLYRVNEKGHIQMGLPTDQQYLGFFAQDVQKALPWAITGSEPAKPGAETEDGSNYLDFDDRPVVAALVNAVQEQQKEIEELKLTVHQLKYGEPMLYMETQ